MPNDGFNKTQVDQFRELIRDEVRPIVRDEVRPIVEEVVDERLEQQDARIVQELERRFAQERTHLDTKFESQKTYVQQFIRDELKDIKHKLEILSERTDDDDKAALKDIEKLKLRVEKIELAIGGQAK